MNKSLPDPDEVWTDDDARKVLAAWQRTTKPLAAFAREHGIGVNRLYWWRKRLGERDRPSLDLVPAVITGADELSVVVRIANNVSVEIANASPQMLAKLIGELARSCS